MKEVSVFEKTISEIEKIIEKNKNIILTDIWSDLKNYKEIDSLLIKNGFKIYYKRPVFYKKVEAPKNSKLVFKKGKSTIKKLYFELLKISSNPDFDSCKINPEKSFKEILSKNPEWNLCAYNKKNELIGAFTIEFNKKLNYGTFDLIYVKEKFRGKKYSIEILKKAEELFMKAKINEWYESTHENNIPMIKSFERYGFTHKRDLIYFIRN